MTSLEEQRRVVADVTAENFPPFDHQGVVVNPFEEEQKRDLAFKQAMAEKILDLCLNIHAWSSARPTRQTEQKGEDLEKRINDIMAVQSEQGEFSDTRSLTSSILSTSLSFAKKRREDIREFVKRLKTALVALANLTSL
ncbi:hypothetical protein HWV62_21794 [Athelia sp. TMB]|nr:hypothetical protein HWV62_21794 [Athelia sp. TMB]